MTTTRIDHELAAFAQKRKWALIHKPYEDSMGFLPCDALGHKVYCVYANDRLIGHSQLCYNDAMTRAIEKTTTTHIDLARPADRHVVIRFDEKEEAFDTAMKILNHLHDRARSDDPVILTFMANIRVTVEDGGDA